MALSILKVRSIVDATNNNAASTTDSKENTMNAKLTMTQDQLQAIINAAVAQAVAQTPAAQPVEQQKQKSLDEAIKGSVSSRFLNWTGNTLKTAAEKTAPVVGKVEVLAVPVTLQATGYMLSKTGDVTESISNKLSKWGKASTAASIRRTPGADVNSIEAQLSSLSKDQLIAMIAGATK